MTPNVEYEPWTRVENIDVPVHNHHEIGAVRVPYAYAASARGVIRTATVSAWMLMRAVRAAEIVARMPQQLAALAQATYEPPLVRFGCPSCNEAWDAWVDDSGHLQDPRDLICTTANCPRMGMPAELLDE